MRRRDERPKQRMGRVWFALEFGMKLRRHEERVVWNFDQFDELAVGRSSAENESGFFVLLAISVVELVAVTVAFVDDEGAVDLTRFGVFRELAWL